MERTDPLYAPDNDFVPAMRFLAPEHLFAPFAAVEDNQMAGFRSAAFHVTHRLRDPFLDDAGYAPPLRLVGHFALDHDPAPQIRRLVRILRPQDQEVGGTPARSATSVASRVGMSSPSRRARAAIMPMVAI